jgi:hypothetical protein
VGDGLRQQIEDKGKENVTVCVCMKITGFQGGIVSERESAASRGWKGGGGAIQCFVAFLRLKCQSHWSGSRRLFSHWERDRERGGGGGEEGGGGVRSIENSKKNKKN